MPDSNLDLLMQILDAQFRGIRLELEHLKESHENSHVEILDMFKRAFPDGDLAGHQKFHQQLIDDANTRKEIRTEIIKKLAAGSAWSIVVYFGYRSLDWIKEYFHVFTK